MVQFVHGSWRLFGHFFNASQDKAFIINWFNSDWTLNNQNALITVKSLIIIYMNLATKVSYETQWNFLTGSFEDNALTSLTYMANGFVFCQLGKKTNDIMIITRRYQTGR